MSEKNDSTEAEVAKENVMASICQCADVNAQIAHNQQELYATLSRSILELHNDVRQLRNKTETLDKVLFSLQQGINKNFQMFSESLSTLTSQVHSVTNAWNEAIEPLKNAGGDLKEASEKVIKDVLGSLKNTAKEVANTVAGDK